MKPSSWAAPSVAAVSAFLLLAVSLPQKRSPSSTVSAFQPSPTTKLVVLNKKHCRLPTTILAAESKTSSPLSPLLSPSLLILFATNDNQDIIINNNNEDDNECASSSSSSPPSTSCIVTTDAAVEVPDPPRLLSVGYNVAGLANAIAALGLLFNIGKIILISSSSSSSFATQSLLLSPSAAASALTVNNARIMARTRYQPNILATYTAGSLGYLFLAAGTCNILSESVKTKRLYTSDTYKRLTMGLLLFGLLGLCSVPGESGCIVTAAASASSSSSSSLWTQGGPTSIVMTTLLLLAKFITAVVSFVGWEYSAGGFGPSSSLSNYRDRMKTMAREMYGGCTRVWKTLPVSSERPATFYRSFFVILTLGNLIFNTPELIFNLRHGMGVMSLPVSLTISSMARLGLMSVILYVLKDAAERKRLDGSTFIKLNIMVGLWALGVGIAQGLINVSPAAPFNLRRAFDKFLFAALFLNNGVLSQLSKMNIIQKRDMKDPDALRVNILRQ